MPSHTPAIFPFPPWSEGSRTGRVAHMSRSVVEAVAVDVSLMAFIVACRGLVAHQGKPRFFPDLWEIRDNPDAIRDEGMRVSGV